MHIREIILAASIGLTLTVMAHAQGPNQIDIKLAASTASVIELTDGEIRKVDKDAKKLTIRHGPIQKLDMPAMTMVFQVKDASMLDRLKTGDKVKFAAENTGGAYVVTHIETAK